MSKGASLVLLALLLFGLPVFASRFNPEAEPVALKAQTKKSSTVADLFRNNCARCHGSDGRGNTPLGQTYNTPDFTDPQWWRKQPNITNAGNLISIVTKGKGDMPAFGEKLNRSQIRLLVNHVRRFKP